MRKGHCNLVRSGPSRGSGQGCRGERDARGRALRVDYQREQGGGGGAGRYILVEPHRQHAAAHVEHWRALGVEHGRAAVVHHRHGHAAGAARGSAVPAKADAGQVRDKPVLHE